MTVTSIDIDSLEKLKAWCALNDTSIKDAVNQSISKNPEIDLEGVTENE